MTHNSRYRHEQGIGERATPAVDSSGEASAQLSPKNIAITRSYDAAVDAVDAVTLRLVAMWAAIEEAKERAAAARGGRERLVWDLALRAGAWPIQSTGPECPGGAQEPRGASES